MRDHPLTPMTDANLVRVLQAQLAPARRDGRAARRVGLVDHRATGASAAAIRARFDALRERRRRDRDRRRDRQRRPASPRRGGSRPAAGLRRLGPGDRPAAQLRHRRLGRGGVAARGEGLRRDRLGQLLAGDQRAGRRLPAQRRRGAPRSIRSSSATTTRRGSRRHRGLGRARVVGGAERPVLVYSTAPPQAVAAAQARSGAHDVGARLERAARRHRQGARRARRAPPRRRRRRDLGRVRAGARRRAAAHRPPDRSRRAVVPRRAGLGARRAAARAEVGQLRRRRFLRAARSRCAERMSTMSEAASATSSAASAARSIARGYVHGTTGNLSARLHDGFLITADRRLPRRPRSGGARQGRRRRPRGGGRGAAEQDARAAPPHLRGGGRSRLHRPHPFARARRAEPRDPRATRIATTCCRRSRRTS